jgi:hypothetical protein
MPQAILKQRIVAAAHACFLPENEMENLANQLHKDLIL